MKKFRDYLTESTLSVADALRILSLDSADLTADGLKVAYKKAAVANHPDKGGDLESMKKINAAYDRLKGVTGRIAGATIDKNWWKKVQEKDAAFVRAALENVKRAVKVDAFKEHFEKIFGETFTATMDVEDRTSGSFSAHASIRLQFENRDKTTVISLSISINSSERQNTGLAAGDQNEIAVYVYPAIYHDRRTIKLTQSRYSKEGDYEALRNPEKIFPTAKLAKKKDVKARGKFSKKDALAAFQRELGAKFFDTFVKIPLPKVEGKDSHVLLYRTTWGSYATYGTNGIYVSNRRVEGLAAMSIIESREIISWFVDQLKELQKLSDVKDVQTAMRMLGQYYKDNLKKIDPSVV
jgi:curved DNA-binding protein CbpA